MQKFYTIKDVAEILQVSQYTVAEWVRRKKLKAAKLSTNTLVRISEDNLKQFIKKKQL